MKPGTIPGHEGVVVEECGLVRNVELEPAA